MIARLAKFAAGIAALAYPALARAQTGEAAVSGALDRAFGQMAGAGGEPLSLSLQLLLVMGLLTIGHVLQLQQSTCLKKGSLKTLWYSRSVTQMLLTECNSSKTVQRRVTHL